MVPKSLRWLKGSDTLCVEWEGFTFFNRNKFAYLLVVLTIFSLLALAVLAFRKIASYLASIFSIFMCSCLILACFFGKTLYFISFGD